VEKRTTGTNQAGGWELRTFEKKKTQGGRKEQKIEGLFQLPRVVDRKSGQI